MVVQSFEIYRNAIMRCLYVKIFYASDGYRILLP